MKIAFFELEGWEEEFLKERLQGHEVTFSKERISQENVGTYHDVEAISVFLYSPITKEVIEQLPSLKIVATRTTGFDHIDAQTCKEKGIAVYTVPFYGENTVAEHAFALLLALMRKIPQAYEQTTKFNFSMRGLRGYDLKDKTFGVIGTGHIGQNAIHMARGFRMNVLGYDPFPKEGLAEQLGFTYVDFDTLLRESDIISLHVPHNEHTHHLINKDAIEKMKEGVIIINTARGGVIDTLALIQGLKSGKVGGAGLDVLEGEHEITEETEIVTKDYPLEKMKELLEGHILITFPNVIVTPHIAFNTKEALYRILSTTVDNLHQKEGTFRVA